MQDRRSFYNVDLFDSRHLLLNIFCSRKVTLSINITFVYFLAHKFKSARNKVSERMNNLGDIYVVECAILLRVKFVCSQDSELMLTRELYLGLLNEAE